MITNTLEQKLQKLSESLEADIVLYCGEIDRNGAESIATIAPTNKSYTNFMHSRG